MSGEGEEPNAEQRRVLDATTVIVDAHQKNAMDIFSLAIVASKLVSGRELAQGDVSALGMGWRTFLLEIQSDFRCDVAVEREDGYRQAAIQGSSSRYGAQGACGYAQSVIDQLIKDGVL